MEFLNILWYALLHGWKWFVGFLAVLVVRGFVRRHHHACRGASYYADPCRTDSERWAEIARDTPQYTPYHLHFLGLSDDMAEAAAERAEREAEQNAVAVVAPNVAPLPIRFLPHEPQRFDQYIGQEEAVDWIRRDIQGLPPGRMRLTKHQLFVGSAGLGKTGLAKVASNELFLALNARGHPTPGFVTVVGSMISKPEHLDNVFREVTRHEGSVLFIDEFHTMMKSDYIDKWLLLLVDHQWRFEGELAPTDLPDFTIMAGTTNYGRIDPAMARRFKWWQLEMMDTQQLATVLTNHPQPVSDEAITLIVSRTHYSGTPAESIALLEEAAVFARSEGRTEVTSDDVQAMFAASKMDHFGLRQFDRNVIKALLTQRKTIRGKRKADPDEIVYAASEAAVVAMARVDPAAYQTDIRPRLMSRGLLTTSSRGQQLTELAVRHYGG